MAQPPESWLDKAIREAEQRGEWDTSASAGKPIPGAGTPYDEDWWLKAYLAREDAAADGMLPASLLLRRDLERLPRSVRTRRSEWQVHETVRQLNERIESWLRRPTPPHVTVAAVDPAKPSRSGGPRSRPTRRRPLRPRAAASRFAASRGKSPFFIDPSP